MYHQPKSRLGVSDRIGGGGGGPADRETEERDKRDDDDDPPEGIKEDETTI
jgi:hypothetical protein